MYKTAVLISLIRCGWYLLYDDVTDVAVIIVVTTIGVCVVRMNIRSKSVVSGENVLLQKKKMKEKYSRVKDLFLRTHKIDISCMDIIFHCNGWCFFFYIFFSFFSFYIIILSSFLWFGLYVFNGFGKVFHSYLSLS